MPHEFLIEGYRSGPDAAIRVDLRLPGVGWARPASATLTEHEVLALIRDLNEALNEAQAESAE